MLPWRRHRREVDDARQRASVAEERAAEATEEPVEAELRLRRAKRQQAEARSSIDALRRQVEPNGWTALFTAAMGGR